MDSQLHALRQQINDSIIALAMQDNGPAEERLRVLLSVVNSGSASYEVMQKAFDLVQQTVPNDDISRKMDYLLDILYSVSARLDAKQDAGGGSQQ